MCRKLRSQMNYLFKRSQDYKRMMRKFGGEVRKAGIAASKNPWDFCFILDTLVADLRFMLEYYKKGENVYQVDESRFEIIKALETALDYYDKWQNAGHQYIATYREDPRYPDHLIKISGEEEVLVPKEQIILKTKQGFDMSWLNRSKYATNYIILYPSRSLDDYTFYYWYNNNPDDWKEAYALEAADQVKYRKLFFDTLADNLESWWD